MILKERDFKTYDLEAENAKEASKLVWFYGILSFGYLHIFMFR
jgi:hypothetical protein